MVSVAFSEIQMCLILLFCQLFEEKNQTSGDMLRSCLYSFLLLHLLKEHPESQGSSGAPKKSQCCLVAGISTSLFQPEQVFWVFLWISLSLRTFGR